MAAVKHDIAVLYTGTRQQSCLSAALREFAPAPLPLRLLCFRVLLPALRRLRSFLCLLIAPGRKSIYKKRSGRSARRENGNFEAGRRTVRAPLMPFLSLRCIVNTLLGCLTPGLLPKPGQAQCLVQRPVFARYCQLRHCFSVSQRRTSCFWRHVELAVFRSHQTKKHGFARLGTGASQFRAELSAHGRSETSARTA